MSGWVMYYKTSRLEWAVWDLFVDFEIATKVQELLCRSGMVVKIEPRPADFVVDNPPAV